VGLIRRGPKVGRSADFVVGTIFSLTRCVKSVTLISEVKIMPVKNPRINVVLEKPLYHTIERLANRDGISLSLKVRDLVKEALEMEEDIALSAFAEKRERTLTKSKALKHHEVW
jgi:hypothetical protein